MPPKPLGVGAMSGYLQKKAPKVAVAVGLAGMKFHDFIYGTDKSGLLVNDQWIAEIKAVDEKRWVAYFKCHGGPNAPQGWAPWTSPYAHPTSASEGYNFIPRVGAQCIVHRIQGLYFITAFYVPSSGTASSGQGGAIIPNHRGNRPDNYNLGDVAVGTADENVQVWSQDGAITAKSRSLSKWFIEPLKGLMRMVLQNWEGWTDGGSWSWSTERDPGKIGSLFKSVFKHRPEPELAHKVTVDIGKVQGDKPGETTLFRMFVKQNDGLGNTFEKLQLEIRDNGDVFIWTKGEVTEQVDGDYYLKIGGKYTVDVDEGIEINSSKHVNMKATAWMALVGEPILENSGMPTSVTELIPITLPAPGSFTLGGIPTPGLPINITNLTSGMQLIEGIDFSAALDAVTGIPTGVIDYVSNVSVGDNLNVLYDQLVP